MMRSNGLSSELVIAAKKKTKEKKYWLNRLGGEPVKSVFPYDYERSLECKRKRENKSKPGRKTKMKVFIFNLAGEPGAKLIKMSNDSDLRLFVIFVSFVEVLLSRYTGNTDIIVGAPIYRREPGGEWLNTVLVIRDRLEEHLSFKQLVLQVGKTIFEAVEHQDYPVGILPDQLGIPYSVEEDDFPLFDTAVLMENIHQPEDLNDIRVNMRFFFERIEKDIRGKVEYNARYYHDATVSRIIEHFNRLVEAAVFDPDAPVFQHEMLSEEEKECLLKNFNDTGSAFPLDKTVVDLFAEQVGRNPEQPAVIEPGGEKALTYKELDEESSRWARVLRQKGVKEESIVGVMLERSIDWVKGVMAVLRAGGVYLPIPPGYPRERVKYMLADSNVKVLLTSSAAQVKEKEESIEIIDISEQFPASASIPPLTFQVSSAELAYVIYTSGSDGWPTGVMVEHAALTNFLYSMAAGYNNDFGNKDKCLSLTDIAIDVSICELFLPLCFGAVLVLLADEKLADPGELARAIVDTAVTFAFIPSVLAAEVNKGIREYVRESDSSHPGSTVVLNKLLVGGEPEMEGSVLQEYRELNPAMRIIHGYGLPETTICAASYIFHSHHFPGMWVPVGKPLGSTEIVILDHGQRLCPIGVPGELWISGAGLARGYLNRPELTADKFDQDLWDYQDYHDDNYQKFFGGSRGAIFQKSPPGRRRQRIYKSGDLGRWCKWENSTGSADIQFLGRIDDQILLSGFRIEPVEIENRLRGHKSIKEAVVIVRESDKTDKYLCAYIVYHIAVETGLLPEPTKGELIDFLSRYLPAYMIPQFFVPLDGIPLTPGGRLDMAALPDPQTQVGGEYVAPESKNETIVAGIWKEILKRDRLGVNDNFFEVGGNSLGLLKVKSRLKEHFGVDIPDIKLLEYPTIRAFCGYLDREISGIGDRGARAEEVEFIEIQDDRESKLKLRSQILEEDDEDIE